MNGQPKTPVLSKKLANPSCPAKPNPTTMSQAKHAGKFLGLF